MSYFVEVILPLNLPKTFTYRVSAAEYEVITEGMRIAVPFGRNKIYTALSLGKHRNPPELYEARDIHEILDEVAVVTPRQLAHWNWISAYYMCSLGDVYRGAMPSALLLESETIISANKDASIATDSLRDEEFLVYQALQQQSSLKVQDVMAILGKKTIFPVIRAMMEKHILTLHEEVSETYKPRTLRYVRLFPEFEQHGKLADLLELLKPAPKQKELLLHYFQLRAAEKKPLLAKRLQEYANVGPAILKALIDKGIFEEYSLQHDRVDFADRLEHRELLLSEAQQSALAEITAHFAQKDVVLLHGVTSSGKTEVYIRLIEQFLETGKQILYLLPEIALTTQLVTRLTAHFGNKVAVYHSKYSNNERVETWNAVSRNSEKAQVTIGARSAMFLPFAGLGLVIIDEEHEQTFKQVDPAPRYHARDAAIVLAQQFGAKVLLGSATPSIETTYNAESGKYGLVVLGERYGKVLLPDIEIVDLKDKYFRKQMSGHFSDSLLTYITDALSLGEQVILFQNRRGYSPVVECLRCGHVPQCSQCDVSMTYHKSKNQLRCHYCGSSMAYPSHCHACHSPEITTKGFGTEQIQHELHELFPQARIGRMDQDTTRGKFGFEKIIDGFRNREIDILVGTQMLAKGLDFDNVSLVGIMNADNMLYHPDFRAFERSYQLMTQVSGRAGRSSKRGKVIIQTYNPLHNIIRQVTDGDYAGMYEEQLYERRIYKYPPYYRLIRITLRHRDYEKVKMGAQWLASVLGQNLDMPVLGPEEPAVGRIRNEYIRTVMIKIPQDKPLAATKTTIARIVDSFEAVPQFRPIKMAVNVDFY